MLSAQCGIIQRSEVLLDSWLPSDSIGREQQLHRLLTELGQNGSKLANHAVLWGDAGSGKTTTARLAGARLQGSFLVAHVSGLREATPYLVLVKTLDTLGIVGPDQQRDIGRRLDTLARVARYKRVILMLDEFHALAPRVRAFLLRTLSEIENLSIVCIVPSLDAIPADPAAHSRFHPALIEFPAYTVEQLREILAARARAALVPESYTTAQVDRISSAAGGDAREAIQVLRRAARMAEQRCAGSIPDACIEQVLTSHRGIWREAVLQQLTSSHRLLFDLIQAQRGISSGELWARYVAVARSYGLAQISPRTYRRYVNEELVRRRLIGFAADRSSGGRRCFHAR